MYIAGVVSILYLVEKRAGLNLTIVKVYLHVVSPISCQKFLYLFSKGRLKYDLSLQNLFEDHIAAIS